MTHNTDLHALIEQVRSGDISRRRFMSVAASLGLSAGAATLMLENAFAQDATPGASPGATASASPVAGTSTSITRAEYLQQLRDHFDIEEPQQTGGTLVDAYTSDISTLNPILVGDSYSGLITGFINEGLAGPSAIDGSPVPLGIADFWELAGDGVTYTFHLHPDAKWQDGTPVTADDVVFTYDSALSEDSLSPSKETINQFLQAYRKIDDKTVEFVAKNQSAVFINNAISQFEILPKHIWEDVPPGEMGSDPGSTGQDPTRVIGCGPFRFVEWVLGDHVTIEKNPDYWDQENLPVIDQYIYDVTGEGTTTIAQLQTGAADMTGLPFNQANAVKESNPELQVVPIASHSFNFYYLNQASDDVDYFQSIPVRQALQYALDRGLIADVIYDGYAERAVGTQPELSFAYAPDQVRTDYTYDPDKARSLLEQEGWVDSDGDGIREKDGKKLSFECLYSDSSGTYEAQIPYMQQAWREVGVEMLPAATPFPTVLEQSQGGTYEMGLLSFGWTFDGFQGSMFRCESTPPSSFNLMRYCNPEYDEIDSRAQVELDDEKRRQLLIEASNIANDDAAAGVTVFTEDVYGASPRLHNFMPVGYAYYWWLPYAWLEQ